MTFHGGRDLTHITLSRKGGMKVTALQIAYAEHLRNMANDAETRTHNRATENLQQQSIDETVRTHLANESIASKSLDETIRSNKAKENISWAQVGVAQQQVNLGYANLQLGYKQLEETVTHNRNVEAETHQSNWATRIETTRHNKETENLTKIQAQDLRTYQQGMLANSQKKLEQDYELTLRKQDHDFGLGIANTIINGFGVLANAAKSASEAAKIIKLIS